MPNNDENKYYFNLNLTHLFMYIFYITEMEHFELQSLFIQLLFNLFKSYPNMKKRQNVILFVRKLTGKFQIYSTIIP